MLAGSDRRNRTESGFTLVEALVTLAIMGIAFAGLLGGIYTSVTSSDYHQKQSQAQLALIDSAEAVKALPYVQCDVSSGLSSTLYKPTINPNAVPTGWADPQITSVRVWNGTAFVAWWNGSGTPTVCAGGDQKLQEVTVRMISPDGRASESMAVVKQRNA